MTGLRDVFRKMNRAPEDLRAENLRTWVSTIPGATPLNDVCPRVRCKVAGVIQNLRIDPREGSGCVEATIIDGTGRLVARWLGRSSLSGIRLGMGLVLEGTPGKSPDGEPLILNPEYELVPGPEHG